MISLELLGALMVLIGLVYMAWSAIHRGRMSDPAAKPNDAVKRTLEPRHRGLGSAGMGGQLARTGVGGFRGSAAVIVVL